MLLLNWTERNICTHTRRKKICANVCHAEVTGVSIFCQTYCTSKSSRKWTMQNTLLALFSEDIQNIFISRSTSRSTNTESTLEVIYSQRAIKWLTYLIYLFRQFFCFATYSGSQQLAARIDADRWDVVFVWFQHVLQYKLELIGQTSSVLVHILSLLHGQDSNHSVLKAAQNWSTLRINLTQIPAFH